MMKLLKILFGGSRPDDFIGFWLNSPVLPRPDTLQHTCQKCASDMTMGCEFEKEQFWQFAVVLVLIVTASYLGGGSSNDPPPKHTSTKINFS